MYRGWARRVPALSFPLAPAGASSGRGVARGGAGARRRSRRAGRRVDRQPRLSSPWPCRRLSQAGPGLRPALPRPEDADASRRRTRTDVPAVARDHRALRPPTAEPRPDPQALGLGIARFTPRRRRPPRRAQPSASPRPTSPSPSRPPTQARSGSCRRPSSLRRASRAQVPRAALGLLPRAAERSQTPRLFRRISPACGGDGSQGRVSLGAAVVRAPPASWGARVATGGRNE